MTDPAPYRRRSRKAPAVLLAVVLLAVLGASSGYVVGRQMWAHRVADQPTQADPYGPGGGPGGAAATADSGPGCPDVSERDAGRRLTRVLYLKTQDSEVWICRDGDGGLWYQGRTRNEDGFTNNNSILLRGVQDNGDGAYLATNTTSEGTTKYYVSTKSLIVVKPGKTLPPEPAMTGQSY